MLAKRIVACLDIRGERVVKGVQFRDLRDAGDPVERAQTYSAQGADEIVILDVGATTDERLASLRTVERVSRALDIPLTVGGGVRSVDDFARLLDAGADKVAVNTAAVENPSLLSLAAQRFGRQCVVLSVDATRANGRYEIAIRSAGSRLPKDAVAWTSAGERLGAGEVLLTSIDRDGTQRGFDLRLIEEVTRNVGIPVVASGGGSTADSFLEALRSGADAVLGASSFHDGRLSISDVKRRCLEGGFMVRQ